MNACFANLYKNSLLEALILTRLRFFLFLTDAGESEASDEPSILEESAANIDNKHYDENQHDYGNTVSYQYFVMLLSVDKVRTIFFKTH